MQDNRNNTVRRGEPRRDRRRAGFSFIEVMLVVVIIGMLAGAVAWKVGGVMGDARRNRAVSDIAQIKKAVETYQLKHGTYPGNSDGLDVIDMEVKTDPWGNPYHYNAPGREGPYEVISFGADGREGGDGENADVVSWELETRAGRES